MVIALVMVLSGLVLYAGDPMSRSAGPAAPPSSVAPGGNRPAAQPSASPAGSLESLLTPLHRPLAGTPTPSVGFLSGVAAFTTDAKVANNTGINTTIQLPSTFTPPSNGCYSVTYSGATIQVCAFLGVEEPLNATETIGIGVLLGSVPVVGTVAYPVGILPGSGNGSFVLDTSYSKTGLTLGTDHTFSIVWSHGEWWNYAFDGQPLVGSGATQANGTYLLNASIAVGITATTGTGLTNIGGGPAEALFELGNVSFTLPQTFSPWAIGIETTGLSAPSYQPVSGNTFSLNSSYPIGIEGHNQLSSIKLDSVIEGGTSIAFPGQYAALWGNAQPLGDETPEAGAYTTEAAVTGSSAIAFNVTLPASISEPVHTAEYLGIQEPVTDAIGIGLGVKFVGSSAYPYYFERNGLGTKTYVDVNDSLAAGGTVSFEAKAKGAGWWSFSASGTAIATASGAVAGNGTVSLGVNTAAAIEGTIYQPSLVLFSETTFPILGLFGNGTLSSLTATAALSFLVPGRGWHMPDFALGYYWSSTFDVEGNFQSASVPPGEVLFGSALSSPMVGESSPLWEGTLAVNVGAAPNPVLSGQTINVTANVSSALAPPASPAICGTSTAMLMLEGGCNLNFTLSKASGNWSLWIASLTAPTLKSSSSETLWINLTLSPTGYAMALGSTSVTVVPPTLVVQAHAATPSLTAGQSDVISIWVNDSQGPAANAFVNATGTVPGLGKTATPVSGSPGLFTDTLKTSAALGQVAHYNLTFVANRTGSIGGTDTITVTVTPLPLLVVSLSSPSFATGAKSGAWITVTVSVDASGNSVSGASVTLLVNPSSPGWNANTTSGVTASNGELQLVLEAPSVSSTTSFQFVANATLSGYRQGGGNATIAVSPAPSTASTSSNNLLLYAGLGIAVAVVVVVLALVLMMRKKKGPSTGAPQGEEMAGPQDWSQNPPA